MSVDYYRLWYGSLRLFLNLKTVLAWLHGFLTVVVIFYRADSAKEHILLLTTWIALAVGVTVLVVKDKLRDTD